jgi:hypothetical protein
MRLARCFPDYGAPDYKLGVIIGYGTTNIPHLRSFRSDSSWLNWFKGRGADFQENFT